MNVTEWRWAIRDSDLPWHAKLVAFLLSTRMDGNGQGARPSLTTLATDCGISRRTVAYAIERLRTDGWIEVTVTPGRQNEYRPTSAPDAPPTSAGGALVQEVHGGSAPDAPPLVQEVHPKKNNRRTTLKTNRNTRDDDFELWWQTYPRRKGKGAAKKAWEKAVLKVPASVLLAAARRYAEDPNLPEPQFVPWPQRWLNEERWNDDPDPPRSATPPLQYMKPVDRWAYEAMKEMSENGQERGEADSREARRELPGGDDHRGDPRRLG